MPNTTLAGLSLAAVEQISSQHGEPDWLRQKRQTAWRHFEELPTPDWSRGIRGWWNASMKDFSFEALQSYKALNEETLPDFALNATDDVVPAGLLVQHNSQVVKVELSDEAKQAGVVFCSLETAVQTHPELVEQYFMTKCVTIDENRFTAAHAALWTGGLFLYVPKDVQIEKPFRAIFYADQPGLAIFTHTLVLTERNARVRLLEEHLSNGQASDAVMLDSGVTEIFVGENAKVEYFNPQEYGENVTNFSVKRAMVGKNGTQSWTVATLGSAVSRLTLESFMVGEGSHTEMNGLSFSTGKQNFDMQTRTLHRASHTSANAVFKAALDDESQLGFRGAIRTEKGAQFTDSFLQDHTLYLSEDSRADVMPSLDVDANDVRCSHGATIGMIDKDQIFYLQSRGLSKAQAEEMIVAGFFEEVIQRVPLESVRERLRQSLEAKMHF